MFYIIYRPEDNSVQGPGGDESEDPVPPAV